MDRSVTLEGVVVVRVVVVSTVRVIGDVSEATIVGDGTTAVAAASLAAGSVGSSLVGPPPIRAGASVIAATVAVATPGLVVAAGGSPVVVQPTKSTATSSHWVMLVIFMTHSSFKLS